MEWSVFYFENIFLILWNTVKFIMHHLISKIYEVFWDFSILYHEKN